MAPPQAPSRVRDMLESRVRKMSRTYTIAERIEALGEIIKISSRALADLNERLANDPNAGSDHDEQPTDR